LTQDLHRLIDVFHPVPAQRGPESHCLEIRSGESLGQAGPALFGLVDGLGGEDVEGGRDDEDEDEDRGRDTDHNPHRHVLIFAQSPARSGQRRPRTVCFGSASPVIARVTSMASAVARTSWVRIIAAPRSTARAVAAMVPCSRSCGPTSPIASPMKSLRETASSTAYPVSTN